MPTNSSRSLAPEARAIVPSHLVELLRWRAQEEGSRLGYTFLQKGGPPTKWTWAMLDAKARATAAALQAEGARGERALIVVPQSLEYIAAFFGCLYANVIAVPTYPPISKGHLGRVQSIAADSQARFLITTSRILQMIRAEAALAPQLLSLIPIVIDEVPDEQGALWSRPDITPSTIAFLQYTSGSTQAPKGVVVSHENILYNERMIEAAFSHDESSVVVGWLPFFHDMGLIGNILQPLWMGVPSILMSPMSFIQRPLSWLAAISEFRGTTSGAPNFAYQMCVDAATDEEIARLDLSSWKVAFNGAEPIHAETLRRFTDRFKVCGFRKETFFPCYGMAETTLLASGGKASAPPVTCHVVAADLERGYAVIDSSAAPQLGPGRRALVGCGRAQLDEEIRIVDPTSLTECVAGRVGEIWVAGPNVTAGYFQRPEETRETFGARIADSDEGPFLRTGDLGFLRADGELFVVGRRKDLIIVRGRNHAPQDLELTVQTSHPSIRATCVAAFSVTAEKSGERVVVVAEVRRQSLPSFDAALVERAVRRSVAVEHELELFAVVFVGPAGVPKTTSGKLQRQACRQSYLAGNLPPLLEAPVQ